MCNMRCGTERISDVLFGRNVTNSEKVKSQGNEIQDINNQEGKVGLASVKLRTKKVPDISEQYEN